MNGLIPDAFAQAGPGLARRAIRAHPDDGGFRRHFLLPSHPSPAEEGQGTPGPGSKLSAGDEVVTTGGLLGKVTEVGDSFVTIEIRRRRAREGAEVPGRFPDAQGHTEKRLNMLEYARWKYIIVGAVLLLGLPVRAPEFLRRGPGAADRAQGPRQRHARYG